MIKVRYLKSAKNFHFWNNGKPIKFVDGIAEVDEETAKVFEDNPLYEILKPPKVAKKAKEQKK